MADFKPTKGCNVEVSSDEPGFHGAYYVATLLDIVDSSPPKEKASNKKNRNKKKMGYKVRYETLYSDDDTDERLIETVDPSFVRPVPPRNVRRKNENVGEAETEATAEAAAEGGGDFEQFDVIDAFHRDGWWIGVIKKVITDGEISKYLVSFESPPEEVEFERAQLRLHVDWVDSRWLVPPKMILKEEVAATHTSESNNDSAPPGFTTPPSKERVSAKANSGFTTPSSKERISVNANSGFTTQPSKERISARKKFLSPRKRNIRNTRIVSSTEEDSPGRKTGSDGNTKGMVSTMETSGSPTIHQDSVLVEEEIIIEASEAEDGKSNKKRKRGRPKKLQVKKPNGSLEDGGNRNSSAVNEIRTDLDEQPLSVWYQGLHPLSVLKRSSCCSPGDESSGALNLQTIVNNGGTTTAAASTDYKRGWPFIKQSPIWATIESLGIHETFTQKPHFSPLKKINEDFREGLAIAHMVTYGNLVHKILKIQATDAVEVINNSLKTLVELETHGFEVGVIRARLKELLSLKSQLGEHNDMKKNAEKEREKLELNKSVVEEEMNQLALKLKELQEKKAQTVEEIVRLESDMDLVSNKIMDCVHAFEKVAATPL